MEHLSKAKGEVWLGLLRRLWELHPPVTDHGRKRAVVMVHLWFTGISFACRSHHHNKSKGSLKVIQMLNKDHSRNGMWLKNNRFISIQLHVNIWGFVAFDVFVLCIKWNHHHKDVRLHKNGDVTRNNWKLQKTQLFQQHAKILSRLIWALCERSSGFLIAMWPSMKVRY